MRKYFDDDDIKFFKILFAVSVSVALFAAAVWWCILQIRLIYLAEILFSAFFILISVFKAWEIEQKG